MQDVTKKKYEQLFKQKKHLGTGSFGRVIKSSSKVDGKTYAVKLMQNVSSMFLDGIGPQAQAMMRAKSDYTVQLLQHFYDQQASTYVFVMPYYSKGNLSQYLQKKWNRLDILSFLYQICQAFLSFSKQGACWHLDLKPDNILVKNQGEYLICDFGCAKLVDNINISRFLQMSLNRGLGTTSYAAPQIIIKMEGGKYSDIWSVGIILYKILYNTHPLQNKQKKQAYRQIIELFASGKQKIQYPPKPGYQQIILLCKQILKPQKRLQWQQLKKAIYQCIGLPLKTQIVVNLQKFISYAQNVSKIVMGLVFYLQKNEQNLNKYKIAKDAQRVISICKAYISLLYRQVQNTIQSETSNQKLNKNDVKSYYIFPQTRKNYSIQQKQRLIHLRAVAKNFCQKQYKENEKVNFLNIKMNFQSQIQQFISILRMENLDKLELHPFSQWHKIGQICNFIVRGNQQKTPGLQYVDRNQIEKFAYKIVYQ